MEEREKLRAKWKDKGNFDVHVHGNSESNDVLEAAIGCFHALSKASLEEEVRCKLLGKIFQSFGDVQRKGVHKFQPEVEKDTNGYGNEEVRNVQSALGKTYKEEVQGNLQKTSMEEVRNSSLFAFLSKAVTQGALELKDFISVVKFIDESELRGPLANGYADESVLPEFEEDTHAYGENGSSKEGCKTQHPTDNTHAGIVQDVTPKAATVPRCSGLCVNGTLCHHVTPSKVQKSPLFADKNEKDLTNKRTTGYCPTWERQTPVNKAKSVLIHPKGVLSDDVHNGSLKEDLHGSLVQPSLSFSEVVQSFQKCSTQELSQKVSAEVNNDHNAPSHVSHDGSPLIKIDNEVLQRRLKLCKFSVIGKLTLAKGEEPWKLQKLKDRLEGIWSFKTPWRLISLGKGFFHVILNSQDELDKVWSRGTLQLKPGIFRIQRWWFDFDPSKERTSSAQVWFRILHLPWVLWDQSVISGIARKIGVPIRLDKATLEGDFGHFARVLIDVDLSKQLMSTVHIECGSKLIEVKLVPEKLPSFCRGCNLVGHTTQDCKSLVRRNDFNHSRNGSMGGERNIKNAALVDITNVPRSLHAGTTFFKKVAPTIHVKTQKIKTACDKERIDQVNKNDLSVIVETITDFSAQTGLTSPNGKKSDGLFVSNQFSVLEMNDEVEEQCMEVASMKDTQEDSTTQICYDEEIILPKIPDMDFPVKEVPKPFHPYQGTEPKVNEGSTSQSQYLKESGNYTSEIIQGLIEMKERGIPNDPSQFSATDQKYAYNGEIDLPKLSPHVKEKWSNIIDEEEEVVAAPVPFDGLILPPSCMTEVDYTTREALISRSFGSTSTTPLYGQWLQAAKRKSKKGKTGFKHKPVRNV